MLFLIGNILLENRIEFLKEKFKDKVTDEEFKKLLEVDPTGNKEYLQFVISRYLGLSKIEKSRFIKEDWEIVRRDLEIYHKIKKMLPIEYKDINKIKSFAVLFMVITKYREEFERIEIDKKAEKEIIRIYEDSSYTILIPKTEEAAILYGKGTRWCTAATETRNYFNDYNEEGPLFIIIHKGEKDFQGRQVKYQFHFETGQFMNIMDRQINFFWYKEENSDVINDIAYWIAENGKNSKQQLKNLILLDKVFLFKGDYSKVIDDTFGWNFLLNLYNQKKISLHLVNKYKRDDTVKKIKKDIDIIYKGWDDYNLLNLFNYEDENRLKIVFKGEEYNMTTFYPSNYRSLYDLGDYFDELDRYAIEKIKNEVIKIFPNKKEEINKMPIYKLKDFIENRNDLWELRQKILNIFIKDIYDNKNEEIIKEYKKEIEKYFGSKGIEKDNEIIFRVSYDNFYDKMDDIEGNLDDEEKITDSDVKEWYIDAGRSSLDVDELFSDVHVVEKLINKFSDSIERYL